MTEPTNKHRETARRLVDELFRNGAGTEATRLVLVVDHPDASVPYLDIGGWGKEAVVDRLVAALADAFTAGRADRQAEDAEIARNFKGGWSATFEGDGNQLAPDPDGPWCLGSDVANAILTTSSGDSYAARIRTEIAERVKALPLCDVCWQEFHERFESDQHQN